MAEQSVAVIGLGAMGYGIAQSCLRAGLTTWGRDLDAAAIARLSDEGGQRGDVPWGALSAVVVVVLNAEQLDTVLFGADGAVPKLTEGAVVLACPTIPPETARRLAAHCATFGVHYLDAPISGGAAKAAEGALSVMASGTMEAFAAAQPVLDAIAATVFELGDSAGAGSAMKATNQLLAGIHIAAMGEALTFGLSQGIAPERFLEVISQCAGTSWMLENRAPHIVAGDYTPLSQINIWPKDLGIVQAIAEGAGLETPIAATALSQYRKAVEMGLGGEDDAAIAKVYARQAGLSLPGES
ncbi:MAG: L-threonate dehydrogenase [Pseudomonadota bacterium]